MRPFGAGCIFAERFRLTLVQWDRQRGPEEAQGEEPTEAEIAIVRGRMLFLLRMVCCRRSVFFSNSSFSSMMTARPGPRPGPELDDAGRPPRVWHGGHRRGIRLDLQLELPVFFGLQ